ncbi:26S proteasome non-ATPase regulatory subunit 4-like [Halichondria panicea]|uniref:26S proteasome non-ATPase regulatory subunit 4-like n=1 Tax=Halichondria panicea TaxID=6063 RepID=UPI00312BB84B
MGLEATVICVDNSEWMRNGDFIPTRLQAQQDAVNAVCHMKTRQNQENSVGLLSLADTQLRVTLTNDNNKIFKALQAVEPAGRINFVTGVRIAHLSLKHRQNKNQKMRIIVFVGSPVGSEEKELVRLAKRLKKEKVSVDIINFGEEDVNNNKLSTFINTINGKEKTCHLVTALPGPLLSEVLLSSPILAGEDGAPLAPMGQGFEFGIDPSEDPELAMALRVSMEEQRHRQEEDARKVQVDSIQGMETDAGVISGGEISGGVLAQAEETDLPYNPDMQLNQGVSNVSTMTEEDQMALALQMSMAVMDDDQQAMDTEEQADDPDDEDLMQNPEFLHSVLSSLPGVNPEEALHNLEQMTDQGDKSKDKKDDKK